MVRVLENLDYPKDRLEALILVERRDTATKQAIAAADAAPFIRIVEIPPGTPQTKPRSCNAGLLLAKGDLIVIYDAADRPDPGQLRVVATQFAAADDTLACVQAKLMVANAAQSFITRQFALEYCLRYELTLPGLARLGLPIPAQAGPATTSAPRCCASSAAGTPGTSPRTPTWACAAPRSATGSRSPTRSPTGRCRTRSRPGPSSAPGG